MTWGNTTGGDHEGADWTPADTTVVGGVHYNIGTFTVTAGYTINIDPNNEFEVYSITSSIVGIINGDNDGTPYGSAGDGGQGADGSLGDLGGGGGGHGGAGGGGGGGGAGGTIHDTSTDISDTHKGGSGGKGGNGPDGGRGGGSVIITSRTLTVSGTITCDGEVPPAAGGTNLGGGGGGSGGGILLIGCAVTVSGTLSVGGGTGGAGSGSGGTGGGGGGGGGRIKVFYYTYTDAGITTDITAGVGGVGDGTNGGGGTVGTYESNIIGKCDATYSAGQVFSISENSSISSIYVWANTVDTTGTFTCRIWDSISKSIEYGSSSISITSTGEKEFKFSNGVDLTAGSYYIEITTTNDAVFSVYMLSTGDYCHNAKQALYVDLYIKIYGFSRVKGVQIYNLTDTTTKCDVCNAMLIGSIYIINTDGAGTIDYNDDFSTNKWIIDSTHSGVTHDTGNDELDIADDGYIYWKCDAKYPITGIPTLKSRINITSGTPTIQISSDASTWYDIDTAIVDDVETTYDLVSTGNLNISESGLTEFYWRYDCIKAAAATCSVKSFELDVDLITIDVEHPKVSATSVSTFRCDQDSDSGIDCNISLIYRDRSWVG